MCVCVCDMVGRKRAGKFVGVSMCVWHEALRLLLRCRRAARRVGMENSNVNTIHKQERTKTTARKKKCMTLSVALVGELLEDGGRGKREREKKKIACVAQVNVRRKARAVSKRTATTSPIHANVSTKVGNEG